jgi:hypothetical protein
MAKLIHGALAVLALAASACRLSAGVGVTRPASATTTTTTSPAPATTTADAPPLGRERRNIYQAEMQALRGLTIEEARQRLKEYGHVGQVTIHESYEYRSECGVGRVCGTSRDGGTFPEDEIVLEVNRAKLKIADPAP